MVYIKDIPQPGDSPGVDSQPAFLENFRQLDSQYGTVGDHVAFEATSNNGKHKKVTLVDLAGDPITTATEGAVYTNTLGARIEAFYRYPSSGDITQLTWIKAWARFPGNGAIGAVVPTDSYNINTITKNGPTIFTITFPVATPIGNANYGIITTPSADPSAIVTTGFRIDMSAGSPQIITVVIIGT